MATDGIRISVPIEPGGAPAATAPAPSPATSATTPDRITPYACYVLAVLTVGYVLNSFDRQIVSILAQSIKLDLKVTDAELGFLLGTAFAIFYAVIGIAMGRIADRTRRPLLMAGGLALWSTMTALGGAATGFLSLGAARMGVGVGEATGTPCSQALIGDYFPPRRRAFAMSVYMIGAFGGSMAAMIVGGYFVQYWGSDVCHRVPIDGACSLAGWKAALIAAGLPGLPLAILIGTLRDPSHGLRPAAPFVPLVVRELGASLPPFTFVTLARIGGGGLMARNLAFAFLLVGIATLLSVTVGDPAQWGATALGAYAIITWGQIQKARDPAFYCLTFGSPTFMLPMIGSALVACVGAAGTVWAAPYAIRSFHLSAGQVGLQIGLTQAATAAVGVVLGGWLTDRWKRSDVRAPIWTTMISLIATIPGLALMLSAQEPKAFMIGFAIFCFLGTAWGGSIAALIQDLVLPRMRASAASAFTLFNVVVAAGIGPYWIGKVSTLTGSLKTGLISVELMAPLAIILLLYAARRLRSETEEDRRLRADAAGEVVG